MKMPQDKPALIRLRSIAVEWLINKRTIICIRTNIQTIQTLFPCGTL